MQQPRPHSVAMETDLHARFLHAWFLRSWIDPHLAPWRARRAAAEFNAVVQTIRSILPEFDDRRNEAITNPIGRTWNRSNRELRHRRRDRLLECHAAFERRRLLARPGADLREARPGREVGVGDR